ncbi:hypothetical protein DUNSADRAFT_12214 [Dunaliella salina]|uniref:Uncharacterized protein n=1 Tax=Dunaliella salina TaxID=3046 RepID=A0ABQ7GBQ6_DUNSA|nr:hypothetical protein DUNSADRAFT_12214 [Dunaliella salina]|eukprot:KAF5832034.1 hypothetical protein DUNSADRAFT_12214 [Dunaliella salina]
MKRVWSNGITKPMLSGMAKVSYTRDGQYLVTGARQDDALLVWDLRYADQALYKLERDTKGTNQRISFSIEPCGRHLLTGGCAGAVRVSNQYLSLSVKK